MSSPPEKSHFLDTLLFTLGESISGTPAAQCAFISSSRDLAFILREHRAIVRLKSERALLLQSCVRDEKRARRVVLVLRSFAFASGNSLEVEEQHCNAVQCCRGSSDALASYLSRPTNPLPPSPCVYPSTDSRRSCPFFTVASLRYCFGDVGHSCAQLVLSCASGSHVFITSCQSSARAPLAAVFGPRRR